MTIQEIAEKINEIDEMIEARESEKVLNFNDHDTIQAMTIVRSILTLALGS